MKPITNILIVKPGAIGDLLQLTPVIKALKAGHPLARISLIVGSSSSEALFRHNPDVTETLVFRKRGRDGSQGTFAALWKHLRRTKYDLVINFQRSNIALWFLLGAVIPCRFLIYHKARGRNIHVVENYLETIAPLEIASTDRTPELFIGKDDATFADDFFAGNSLVARTVIAINPGASHPVNRWNADRFAALADALEARFSARTIIVGGPEDRELAESIASSAASKPIVMTGQTTLLQLGAILKKCGVLVSGDTGPLHIAAAVNTRVVALFGAADPARTGPRGPGHRVIQAMNVPCIPCRSRVCTHHIERACMQNISVQQVLDAIHDILNKPD